MAAVELPFLFRTRTILRCRPRSLKPRNAGSRLISTECIYRADSAAEASPGFLEQKSKERLNATKTEHRKATITSAERRAFNEIFKDLTKSANKRITSGSVIETDPDRILELFTSPVRQRHLEEPAGHTPAQTGQEQHTKRTTVEGVRPVDPISKYPPSLRSAARRAAQRQRDHAGPCRTFQPSKVRSTTEAEVFYPEADPHDQIERNFAAEIARDASNEAVAAFTRKELKSIADELHGTISTKANPGAFRLWEVSLKRIYPLVKLLDKSSSAKQKNKDPAQFTKYSGKSENTDKHGSLKLPVHVKPLSAVTQLYPAALLLVLRLYLKHYPTSPFPLAMLFHIRSLGPMSYVLGLNTHFYNTLLTLLFSVYSDLPGIDRLLAEMQKSSVEFDIGTYEAILSIEEERWKDLHGAKDEGAQGGRDKAWWNRPEQVKYFQRVGVDWKRVVAANLQELGLGVTEMEHSGQIGGMHGEAGGSQGEAVWI